MKMTHLAVAAALALVPATATLANDAKKEALKKAKEKMKEAAKEKAAEKTANLKTVAATKAAPAAANNEAAQRTERELHARNLGVIERLQQIAVATNDANLKVAVERLNGKEGRRHDLALSTM